MTTPTEFAVWGTTFHGQPLVKISFVYPHELWLS